MKRLYQMSAASFALKLNRALFETISLDAALLDTRIA
jgi:hypothetical protein